MKNFAAIRGVLVYTMVLNLLVTATKLIVGYLTGSLSLIADGFDSLFDGASNVVGLVGIYVASRPPDPGHPYGHRKFEALSAASITILLFLTTVELVRNAIDRLRHPVKPEVNVWTFAAILVSVVVHLYVAWYEHRRGKELKSEFLVADALHTRADVLVSISVGAGMILVRLGFPVIDVVLALVIAALIAKIGIDIIRDTSKVLADASALDVTQVQRIVGNVPGVQTFHRIRSRGQEDDVHLDLHVQVRPGTPVEQAHAIAHEVESRLVVGIPGLRDVVVHVEPGRSPRRSESSMARRPCATVDDVRRRHQQQNLDQHIRAVAGRLPGTSVHGIQARNVGGRLYLTLHLEVERTLSVEEGHALADKLEGMLRAEIPQTVTVDVHVEPAGQRQGRETAVAAGDPDYQEVHGALAQATREVGGLSDVHDLVVSRVGGCLLASAHWECDGNLSVEEAHALSKELEHRAQEHLPALQQVVVHIEPRTG